MPDGLLRKSAPYLFVGQTTSLCEECLGLAATKIVEQDGAIWYLKRCPTHGVQKTLVSTDPVYWRRTLDYLKPGDRPQQFQSRTEHGCPWDCGLCPDHEQHSCLAIIEINEACNLSCPVCFADSSPRRTLQRSLPEIERMMDALVASEGEPDLLQISGGEPTIHPQILEILAAAKRRPIRHLMLNTNGIRIAEDPAFVEALAGMKKGFEIYLQFDSLNDAALREIRGASLNRIRRQALEALERHGISTTLVCTVKKGVNDSEAGEIVRHALQYRCVRGVNFQPVQDAGRNEGFDPKSNRIVLSEIRRRIVEDSGVFGDADMVPLPCNPASIAIGYGLREGTRVLPLTSMIPKETLTAAVPNTLTFEQYPELRRRFVELLSLSTADDNTSERLGSLLCCLPQMEMPPGTGYENVFRVTIVEFLDRFNFCVANVKRSCVHFVTPEGRIVPFDTYNLFYRPGAAGNRRLAAEQVRAKPSLP
jgi:uncharacterized radical SAM superfamily Fe-S cluster-containing enzyme